MSEGQYFTVDSRALSFAETWRVSPNPVVFVVAATLKIFRSRFSFKSVIPAHLKPRALSPDEIPRWAEKWFAAGTVFADKGLTQRLTYTLDALGAVVTIGRVWIDDDNAIIAQICASLKVALKRTECSTISCHTRIVGPRWIVTASRRPELASPVAFLSEVVHGGEPAAVLKRHRERIRQANIERIDDLEQELAIHNRVDAAFQMKRGVWVLATPEEITAARAVTPRC